MEIDQREVLRYLGHRHQTIDQAMANLIKECLTETQMVMRKDFVCQIYPLEKEGNQIRLDGTNLTIESNDLSKHLQNSDQCILFAATLGVGLDQRIATYSRLDLTRAIILDACATAAIEALCDEGQNELRAKVEKEGYYLTSRYSPGYGDLAITHQKVILDLLQAYTRIGLTVNEDFLLLPRKSVTAFIGLEKKKAGTPVGGERPDSAAGKIDDQCRNCQDKTCRYRKGGVRDE